MDEHVKASNKIINIHIERTDGIHSIKIQWFLHDQNLTCEIFGLTKRFYVTINFIHNKSQLSFRNLDLYRYINI